MSIDPGPLDPGPLDAGTEDRGPDGAVGVLDPGSRDVGHRGPGNPTTASAPHRIAKIAATGPVHGTWLDVGCGAGDYAGLLTQAGCDRAVGIDLALRPPLATRHAVSYAVTASERLPFAGASFDGALVNEVLEHVDDEGATLGELHRVLRPGARLVVFSPNRWFPFEGHGAVLRGREIDAPVPLLPWLPMAVGRRWMRARNYWPSELRRLVAAAGFDVRVVGFAFPLFITVPWLPPRPAARARQLAPGLERTPVVRRFGVSTMIDARRP
jgi:SAM-dependent methyltransferase